MAEPKPPVKKGELKKPASKSQAEDKIKLPLWAWAVVGGFGLVVAWRLYQAKKSSEAPAGNAGNATGAASPSSECTDASGNPIPCNTVTPVYNQINNLGPMEQQQYQTLSGQYSNIQQTLTGIQGVQNQQFNPSTSPWGKYTVKQGDTWASIIAANGPAETPTYIQAYNALAGITIPAAGPTTGQTIWLPAGNVSGPLPAKASAQSQGWAVTAQQIAQQAIDAEQAATNQSGSRPDRTYPNPGGARQPAPVTATTS